MPGFHSSDGTRLSYRLLGSGPPLIAIPGGPGRASGYLAGIADALANTIVLLDNRGTGESAEPATADGYRAERVADDIEALRRHLGLPEIDLFAHSSASNAGIVHACRHPATLRSMVLVSPSPRAAGIVVADMAEALDRRAHEPWFPAAKQAIDRWAASKSFAESMPYRQAAAPFFYVEWAETSQAHAAAEETSVPAAEGFYRDFAVDTASVRARLAELDVPVLVLVGELDPFPTPATGRALAEVFRRGELAVQTGAGHYPWVDDPVRFGEIVGRS